MGGGCAHDHRPARARPPPRTSSPRTATASTRPSPPAPPAPSSPPSTSRPSPRVYGETAAADGKAAFDAVARRGLPARHARQRRHRGDRAVAVRLRPRRRATRGRHRRRGRRADRRRHSAALPAWRDAGPEGRTGVCLEILARLHGQVFELANAVQHTSGQAFVMAFQAGGAHALDRALEAIAYAYAEMTRTPGDRAVGEARPGRAAADGEDVHVVPRGVALVIGCNTFPTWNSWPGLFASLVTGNPVVVKPHPGAVLPLAITVQVRPRGAGRGRLRPQPGHARRRGPRRPARRGAGAAPRGAGSSTSPAAPPSATGWRSNARQAVGLHREGRRQHRRRRLHRRLPRDVPNLALLASRSTPGRCAPPRRTSSCPPTASRPTRATRRVAEVGAGIAAAVDKLLGDDARAVELLGGDRQRRRARPARGGAGRRRGAGALARGHPPGVRRRDGAHPAARRARPPTTPTSTRRSASARSPS